MPSKRGQNEGSIHKRKDGRWVGTVSLGYRNGKRQRKSFYGQTRGEVRDKLLEAQKARQENLPLPSERQTVKKYLEHWLEQSARVSLRPRTFEGYESHVNLHITPALGHVRLAKLTPEDVQQLLNDKLKSGLSPRTVRYIHAVLRRALNQAVKRKHLSRNVATLVDLPRSEDKEVEPLSPDQARELLAAIEGDRLEALYTVALALGLRKGEALGLLWADVDLDGKKLTVRHSLQRIDGKLQLVETKTRKSRRTIAMPDNVAASLRNHRANQLRERLLAGGRWQDTGLVFTTTIGTPIDGRKINGHFTEALKRAGLPQKRFHDLRHTCATLLLVQGVPARVVMEILGHSTIALTMNTYSHVIPELQREAADLMDAVLGEQK